MSNGEANRFVRSQAIGPATLIGGGRSGLRCSVGGAVRVSSVIAAPYRSTSAMRRLYQFMNSEISRLRLRKNTIRMRDVLDRAAGLVLRRADDRVADPDSR